MNARLARRRAWVILRFIELLMERERSMSLVLRDLVLYAGHVVGAVDELGVMCLVRLRVCVAMGSFTVVLYLFVLGVGLVKVSRTP